MGWELEPCSSPSAALMTWTSLRPGERLEGTPPRLTLSPAPGTLRLWGHSAAGKESLPPKDRCSYSVSFQTLSPESDVGNTWGHIVLKSQSPAFSFPEVIQDLTVDLIQWWQSLLWRWLDGLSCTWSLRKYWWCKEPRDQLDSGPDHAAWPVNSPVYTRFQESPAGETRIFQKCIPAFKILHLSWCPISQCLPLPTSQPPPSVLTPRKGIPAPDALGLACIVKGPRKVALASRPQDRFKGNRKDFWVLVNLLQSQEGKLVWPER